MNCYLEAGDSGKLERQFSLRPENRGADAINANLRAGEDEGKCSAQIVRWRGGGGAGVAGGGGWGGGGVGKVNSFAFYFLIRPSVD